MSCEIDSDSFHTKKGDRRKTVSKRRAYNDTPDELKNKITEILMLMRTNWLTKPSVPSSYTAKRKAQQMLDDIRRSLDEW